MTTITMQSTSAFNILPSKDVSDNNSFADVLGNKTDAAANTTDTASIIALLRYIIANADSAAAVGGLTDVANTGAPDNAHTMMSYVKELVVNLNSALADLGVASGSTLTSLYGILGNPATSLSAQIAALAVIIDNLPNSGALSSLAQDSTVAKAASVALDSTVAKAASFGTFINTGGTATLAAILGDFANSTLISKLNALATTALVGTPVGASISADILTISNILTGVTTRTNAIARQVGKIQIKEVAITSAANAGLVTIATATAQNCVIKTISLRAVAAAQTDLTSAAIKGGTAQAITFISAATAIKANIAAIDQQVSFDGSYSLPATKTIVVDLQGSGSTPVNLVATIEYCSTVDGGYLA